MRFKSWKVNVGVILRQQFEQAKQFISCQTSLSISSAIKSSSFGGLFSSLVRNLRKRERCICTDWSNFLRYSDIYKNEYPKLKKKINYPFSFLPNLPVTISIIFFMWEPYKKGFKSYLQLEKSLAKHSIDAYVHDIEKLTSF